MILNNEELKARLKAKFGESVEDDDISFIEDITDTFDSYENNTRVSELESHVAELENQLAEQKKKYRDRFFSVEVQEEKEDEYEDGEPAKPVRYEELFEEVK